VKKPTILVVDDQPVNIKLLEKKLLRENMEVWTAIDGQTCLEIVKEKLPDLILLDVMMPNLDGIEVCERLKEDERTRPIPIIFITANSSKEGKLEGLKVGAVDYITKPIDLDETMARINTQLKFLEVNRQNMELTRRLGEVRRNATIGAITQGIAHNINNLLGVVVGYLDLIKTDLSNEDLVHRGISVIDKTVNKMTNIVKQLSRLASQMRIAVTPLSAHELIDSSVVRFVEEHEVDFVEVDTDIPEVEIFANRETFEDTLGRLLENAMESYHRTEIQDPKVIVKASVLTQDGDEYLKISVIDHGKGIPEDIRDNIFEPFVTIKANIGAGMGLTVARHAMRSLGGELEILDNPDGQGIVANMVHPLKPLDSND